METEYLKNKKASFAITLSWMVATILIIIFLVFYFFAAFLIKGEIESEITYKNFLSTSLEREFYTFLDEKIIFEGKETSIKEILNTIEPRKDVRIEGIETTPLEKKGRKFAGDFLEDQSKIITIEKEIPFFEESILFINYLEYPSKTFPYFYLAYQEIINPDGIKEQNRERSLLDIETAIDGGKGKIVCNENEKDSIMQEVFISPIKKIMYCINY